MKRQCSMQEAINRLLQGGVGVLPTDTVYGLAARATDAAAVQRLYALKRREHKPGTLIAANVDQLIALGLAEADVRRAEPFWPNPLSAVLQADEALEYVHQGMGSLVARIPKDADLRRVLEQTGVLVTSSANQPGEPSSETLQQAWDYFGDSVDFYVDGGNLAGRAPSTIVRLSEEGLEVLREGVLTRQDLGLNG